MQISHLFGPLAPPVGFGGAVGLAVGYTVKKLTKVLALLLGSTVILLQLAAYTGFVTVNWGAVQGMAAHVWTTPQGMTLAERLWEILSANLPFGSGFVAGFAIGLRLG